MQSRSLREERPSYEFGSLLGERQMKLAFAPTLANWIGTIFDALFAANFKAKQELTVFKERISEHFKFPLNSLPASGRALYLWFGRLIRRSHWRLQFRRKLRDSRFSEENQMDERFEETRSDPSV